MNKQNPNVIIVITDDQGYGDLGCTGNPWIKTVNIDEFYNDSVRLTDFHVSPLCAPTRGALMTGHRPLRNGVWATCWGRSILSPDEQTLGNLFENNGYATGMFGKWHLGDNYPYRPQDRGFQRVVAHKGGGVGQTPDFWGNNYFDDTYFNNGKPHKYDGYCTDVWFDCAMKFISEKKDVPFFAVISTNAPHEPYLVSEKYSQKYRENKDIVEPEFYGMIENIDENFGKLRQMLQDLEIEDNTILIFMTDNGTSGGCTLDKDRQVNAGYNAGMRGMKGSYYDGGHRVPFFMRHPSANICGGQDVDEMTLHLDMFDTFATMCNLNVHEDYKSDGMDISDLILGKTETLPTRYEFIQFHQSTDKPEKWDNAVISDEWRLVYGKELYNIKSDKSQKHDVSEKHPEIVGKMRKAHEEWWAEAEPFTNNFSHIVLGNETENPTRLDSMDVMGDVTWNQISVANAMKSSGRWNVEFDAAGTYEFQLRRWPNELLNIKDNEFPACIKLAPYAHTELSPNSNFKIKEYYINLNGVEYKKQYNEGDTFTIDIDKPGKTIFEAGFILENNEVYGAYYVYVRE